jgi:hypothetical protein
MCNEPLTTGDPATDHVNPPVPVNDMVALTVVKYPIPTQISEFDAAAAVVVRVRLPPLVACWPRTASSVGAMRG